MLEEKLKNKSPWWKQIFECKNYYILMIILVPLAIIVGRMGMENEAKGTGDLSTREVLNSTQFIVWSDAMTELIDVNFVSDEEGYLLIDFEQYDENYNLIADEYNQYNFVKRENEEIYDIYWQDGTDTGIAFTITYEQCPVLHVYDEATGEENVYLEKEWAYNNVG